MISVSVFWIEDTEKHGAWQFIFIRFDKWYPFSYVIEIPR